VKLDDVGSKKPTPQVHLNDAQFQSTYNWAIAAISNLGSKKPTPTAFMNNAPFVGAANSMSAMLTYLQNRRISPSATLIANTLAAENALNNAARTRYAYVYEIYRPSAANRGSYAAATGGKVGDIIGLAGKRFDIGGKITGPGGPTDDLIQGFTNSGMPFRVSNTEWVIRGSSSSKYGDQKMAAINAGTAIVSLPGPRPASSVASVAAGSSPTLSATADGVSSAGRSIVVQHLDVHFEFTGPFAMPDRAALRKAAIVLRDELVKVEAEGR
jgi:hypothetical protein